MEELRPILLKIQSREALVEDRIELERLQLNPDRLKNRSANAFAERKREESMVKGVRSLERVTAELVGMIEAFEGKYGEFEYSGIRYLDRIARQEETYQQIKESLRNTRTRRQNNKTEVTPAKTDYARKAAVTAPRHVMSKSSDGSGAVSCTAIHHTATLVRCNTHLSASASKIVTRLDFPPKKNSGDSIENKANHEDDPDCASIASDGINSGYSSETEVRERESTVTVVRAPEL